MNNHFGITRENVAQLYNPATDGILLLKGVLSESINQNELKDWYDAKSSYFERKDEKIIENNQRVSLVFNGPADEVDNLTDQREKDLHTLYMNIRNAIGAFSGKPLKQGDRYETKLMLYPVSKLGVGAHKDLSSNINMVVIMNIYGTTNFYTSSDKNRNNEKTYLIEPGDICIMRGPRDATENAWRPIHYVLDINEERLVFVCREIEDKTEQIINKNNWMGF